MSAVGIQLYHTYIFVLYRDCHCAREELWVNAAVSEHDFICEVILLVRLMATGIKSYTHHFGIVLLELLWTISVHLTSSALRLKEALPFWSITLRVSWRHQTRLWDLDTLSERSVSHMVNVMIRFTKLASFFVTSDSNL